MGEYRIEKSYLEIGEMQGLDEKEGFKLRFSLLDLSKSKISKIQSIPMGKSWTVACENFRKFEQNLKQVKIFHDEEVAVLIDESHKIMAISAVGEGIWLDVNDDFKQKEFSEFCDDIEQLVIH